jgi:hypothetical protein
MQNPRKADLMHKLEKMCNKKSSVPCRPTEDIILIFDGIAALFKMQGNVHRNFKSLATM